MSRFTFNDYNASYLSSLDTSLYKLQYTLTSYTTNLKSIYNLTNYAPLLLKILLISSIFYYILLYIYKLIGNTILNQDNSSVLFDYFSEVEEEVGSLDDIIAYALVYLSVAVSFFLTIFFVFFFKTSSFLILLFNFILLIPVLVPTFVIKNYGWGFLQYLRGVTRTSSLMFESFLDLVSVTSMYLRFFIQNIRFFFIFLAFFECYEFIYLTLLKDFSFLNIFLLDLNNITFFTELNSTIISVLFLKTILFFYYVGHLATTFVAQITSYFILSFWLFFFLYTSFSSEKGEAYFLNKKAA